MKRSHAIFSFVLLTILLTAGAAQSLAGSNTVYSDDIVNGQVRSADIANGTVTGTDIATSTISGAKIADNTVSGADVNEASLVLTCPAAAPTKVGDVCFGPVRPEGNWNTAASDCVDQRLRLPSQTEGMLIQQASYVAGNIWTDGRYHDDNGYGDMVALPTYTHVWPDNDMLRYRCVTTVGARP